MGFITDAIGITGGAGDQKFLDPYKIREDAFRSPDAARDRAEAVRLAQEQERRSAEGYRDQQEARGGQVELARALEAQMRGEGPTVADEQLRRGTERAAAQTVGAVASQRGVNPALAARSIATGLASSGQQAASDAALLRAQEQLAAQGQAANVYSQIRGQDQSATAGAEQAGLARTDVARSASEADRAAGMAKEQLEVQQKTGLASPSASIEVDKKNRGGGFIQGILQGGSALMSSDERNKKNVEKVDSKGLADALAKMLESSPRLDSRPATIEQRMVDNVLYGSVEAADTARAGKQDADARRLASTSSEVQKVNIDSAPDAPDKLEAAVVRSAIPAEAAASVAAPPASAPSTTSAKPSLFQPQPVPQGGGSVPQTTGVIDLSAPAKSVMSSMGGSGGGEGGGGAGIASLLPLLAMFSDRKAKTDVKISPEKVSDFLNKLKAYTYEYKEGVKDQPMAGDGRYLSPMAQDLEKSEIGKTMVVDTPDGKVVDYGKGFGAILAAQAELNKRLKAVEAGKKS